MNTEHDDMKRIVSLDGLRFFAAMCIVFGHIHTRFIPIKNVWANWAFFEMRSIGMTLFFILSGFVISVNYKILGKNGCSLRRYFIHRFSRIYPLFLLIFLYEILFATIFPKEVTLDDIYLVFFSYLTLTHAWFFGEVADNIFSILVFGVSWSLSVEFFFYLVYPFVEKVLKKLEIKRFKIFLYVFIIIFFILLFIYYQFSFSEAKDEGIDFDHGEIRWFVYFSPYLSVFEFIIGCILARIYLQAPIAWTSLEHRFRKWFLALAVMSLFMLYAIVVCRMHPVPHVQYEAFYLFSRGLSPFLAYIVFYTARYVQVSKGQAIILLLGELSYPIYLVHWTLFEKMFGVILFKSWLVYAITITYMLMFLFFFSYGILRLYDFPVRTMVRKGLTRWLCRTELHRA